MLLVCSDISAPYAPGTALPLLGVHRKAGGRHALLFSLLEDFLLSYECSR